MNGSESERMIDEIETFLRTGQAPPAAPEPPRVVGVAQRPPPTDDVPTPPLGRRQQVRARVGAIASRVRGRPSSSYRGRLDGGARRGHDPWTGRPKWTPARVVVILSLLLALLVVPSVLARRSSAPAASASDHASAAPAGPGYTFLSFNPSGTPVRWNPCTPIGYSTDLVGAPSYAAADLSDAIQQLSAATGISFVGEGSTTVFPSTSTPDSASGSASGSAGRPGPVVIAWATPQETAGLGPVPAGAAPNGMGRAAPVEMFDPKSGFAVYVTGTVIIEAGADRLPSGFGPGGVGNVLLHELGQLIGLGPIDDPNQIMNPTVVATKTGVYAPGDLAGLHRLGAASGCVKPPSSGTLHTVL